MNIVDKIYSAMVNCSVDDAIECFGVEHNDEITNGVREKLDLLPEDKILEVRDFLNNLLNLCYGGELCQSQEMNDSDLVEKLGDKLFLFKESVIYFLGRLSVKPDIEMLKKAYFMEDNKYIKLNLTFTSLCTFDETIEMDFVKKCRVGSEYDVMLRSWTMAYFMMIDNPYSYVDDTASDWTKAKMPRIKRLSINDEEDKKYMKAMSFRLMDLLVLSLFVNSREGSSLSLEERRIIENSDIQFEAYSNEKKKMMMELKEDILNKDKK